MRPILTPLWHFHPLNEHLDISRAITTEKSPLLMKLVMKYHLMITSWKKYYKFEKDFINFSKLYNSKLVTKNHLMINLLNIKFIMILNLCLKILDTLKRCETLYFWTYLSDSPSGLKEGGSGVVCPYPRQVFCQCAFFERSNQKCTWKSIVYTSKCFFKNFVQYY